jgi:hypothetical protein
MTRKLTRSQIDRLERIRIALRLTIPQFKLAMDAPFPWPILFRALRGKAIQEASHRYIVNFLGARFPEKAVPDGKAAAANDAVLCSE